MPNVYLVSFLLFRLKLIVIYKVINEMQICTCDRVFLAALTLRNSAREHRETSVGCSVSSGFAAIHSLSFLKGSFTHR